MRWEEKKAPQGKVKKERKYFSRGRKEEEKKKKKKADKESAASERTFPFGRPCIHVDVRTNVVGSPANPKSGVRAGKEREREGRVGMIGREERRRVRARSEGSDYGPIGGRDDEVPAHRPRETIREALLRG